MIANKLTSTGRLGIHAIFNRIFHVSNLREKFKFEKLGTKWDRKSQITGEFSLGKSQRFQTIGIRNLLI
jgi:hypothetical protein